MRAKLIPCIALVCFLAFAMTGCESVTDVFDEIVDAPEVSDSSPASENGTVVTADASKEIDRSLAVPLFVNAAGLTENVSQGTAITLDGTATSTDGGTITYQWYTNNVSSNGGGTAIEGATDAVYSPDTSEVSTKFYYVVAKNEHDSSYMMGTGPVFGITVIKKGTFTTDELGGVRYLSEDGTYPSDMWVLIDKDTYLFNSDGYISVGWVDMGGGNAFYFTEEGKLLRNTVTPDGYTVDENGRRQGDTPVITPEAAAAEEQPAEEQPAEEQQPAEEVYAEEQPAEEQPAEEVYYEEEYSE